MKINQKQLWFALIFVGLGLLSLQVPLLRLAGSKAQFTLFDAFAPIASGFLGSVLGIAAVGIMELSNFFLYGAKVLDLGTVTRFLPPLFAAMYFGRKTHLNWIIPTLAIMVFNLNPVGRSVWFYSLFWLIPIICYFWQDRFLLARSLGSTFTAHAVGGAIWIWAFHLPKAVWISLIPVVIEERLVFAAGIALSFIIVKRIARAINPMLSSYQIQE